MTPSENPDDPRAWFGLSEEEFLRVLEETTAHSGNPGDVFPPMVSYNVPWFVLRDLWPAAHEALGADPQWMAFAAAEEGWRGRLDSIRSTVAREGERWRVQFAKTYVMTASELLLLVGSPQGPGLCRVSADPNWDWTEREEEGLRLVSTRGRVVAHYRVRGAAVVSDGAVFSPGRRAYSRVGLVIPRREVTGMAMMALGMLRFLGLSDGASLGVERDRIFAGRSAGHLGGEEMAAALRILDQFYSATKSASLEAFWSVVASFRKTVGAALRLPSDGI